MRPNANLNINLDQFPEWFRPHWQILNRAMSDVTKIFSNGIVMSENMSLMPRTATVTNATVTTIPHSLNRNPIVQVISGRVLGMKVQSRTSNYVDIWCKLPSSRIISGRGKRAEFLVEDAEWFFPGDVVKIGDAITSVTSLVGDRMLTKDAVVLSSDMKVSLHQESIDLLLF